MSKEYKIDLKCKVGTRQRRTDRQTRTLKPNKLKHTSGFLLKGPSEWDDAKCTIGKLVGPDIDRFASVIVYESNEKRHQIRAKEAPVVKF